MDRCIGGRGILYAALVARLHETPEQAKHKEELRQRRARRRLLRFMDEQDRLNGISHTTRPTAEQQRATVRRGLVRAVEAFEKSQQRGLPQRPICSSASYSLTNYQPSPAYAVA